MATGTVAEPDTRIQTEALRYLELGWSLIPIEPETKTPPKGFQWRPFRTQRADRGTVESWFFGDRHYPAVIFGAASGGLACRDFDEVDVYERWAAEYPDVAELLPTVRTHRGWHVYFTLEGSTADLRRRLRKSGGNGHINVEGGELRFDAGSYCLLPPAVHPDGTEYAWVRDPFNRVPEIDPVETGLANSTAGTDRVSAINQEPDRIRPFALNTESTEDTDIIEDTDNTNTFPVSSVFNVEDAEIQQRIRRNLPSAPSRRNKQMFELLRDLHSLEGVHGTTWADVRDWVIPILKDWYRQAADLVTDSFEQTVGEAAAAWGKVRQPKDQWLPAVCLERAKLAELPPCADGKVSDERVGLLVKLCRELQREHERDEPFYLSTRDAGELLGVPNNTAWFWLRYLREVGILVQVRAGTPGPGGRASEFQFCGPLMPQGTRAAGETGD